jgi:hypothetical protein
MINQGTQRRRVWILGAGFSRSLGGPLMGELLSLGAWRDIVARYSGHLDKHDAELVFLLFHCGAGFPEGPPTYGALFEFRAMRRWRDAEEFMEILDSAQDDPAKEVTVKDVHEQLKEFGTRGGFTYNHELPPMRELARRVRRVIAASCSTFMEGTTPDSAGRKERWQPYQQWLGLLREYDSILTFNYDRVVETLRPNVGNSTWAVHVVGVDNNFAETEWENVARRRRLPLLYKLHGSVNWNIENGQIKKSDWSPALLEEASTLAIATPGDSKMEMAGGVFRKLWSKAEEALREAEEIFILGFRFPPSDALPRDRLLAQIRDNEVGTLCVHVVLGPDDGPDRKRVLALLRSPVGAFPEIDRDCVHDHRQLIAHTMFAEDFLSDWAQREEKQQRRA